MQPENIPTGLLISLIRKHLNDEITLSEREILQLWIAETEANKMLLDQLSDKNYRRQELKEMAGYPDQDIAFERFILKMKTKKAAAKMQTIWFKAGLAAAVVLMVFGAGLFYYSGQQVMHKKNAIAAAKIVSGREGATLTLSNGKKIRLTDALSGQVAKQNGVVITKAADGQLIYEVGAIDEGVTQLNTLSTGKGESYRMRMTDGTIVFLNAASSITYATQLTKEGNREVVLKGEGYFEVAKDKAHPFIVKTDRQEVEVLGTHFNINAYSDENSIKTTLLEGSVHVRGAGFTGVVLRPGQQSALSGTNKLSINTVDVNEVIDWKNGEFVFDNESLESILRKVARWYDVEIIYQGANKKTAFWGSVSRYDHIGKVLDKLELTGDVHFKIDGRRIYVIK